MQRVSIKEVAKRAGVSTATVSNVFSGKKPVNADLAEKVRSAANELGYQINKAASQLRSGKNSVVSVLVPDLSGAFFTSIIKELEKHGRNDGYEIIVGNSSDDPEVEAGRLDALLAWQPAGLVVVPCSDELPSRLRSKDLPPCVVADRISDFSVHDSVCIDNNGAGAMAAKFLAENGHNNILIAASNLAYAPIRERVEGAKSALSRIAKQVDIVELGSDPSSGADKLSLWFDKNDNPTGIIAINDMTTLAVLTCLAARRIDMPDEISVVGFDDYPWMKARKTGITAVRQPVNEIALQIWKSLVERMSGKDGDVHQATLDCSLVVRDSVKKLGVIAGEPLIRNLDDDKIVSIKASKKV